MLISEKRVSELDGLRGIAILLVLVWHFTGMLTDPNQGTVQYLAWRYLIFGQSGVDLFFVLSGYLIIGILIDTRETPDYFATFYKRRALRILPPYLILVAGYWTCVYLADGHLDYYFNRQLPLWSLLTFTQNWVMASIDSFGSMSIGGTWSLAIEEQFYMFAPALILLVPKRWLAKVLLATALASIIARSGYYALHTDAKIAPYVGTIFRLDGLCVGGLIAISRRNPAAWSAILNHRTKLLAALIGLAVLIPGYTWLLRSDDYGVLVLYHFGHTYLALLYGAALSTILAWSDAPATKWLRSKIFVLTGSISYSLYLFHPSFKGLFFVFAHRGEQLTAPIDMALLAGAFIATFAFCALLYQFVERPARQLGHRPAARVQFDKRQNSSALKL
jgi:peptidoglycan/LPS O-acetylase OafA/YrhL